MKSLEFRLLGFPVIVHPMAWLVLGYLLLTAAPGGPQALLSGAISAVVLFGSILFHELGHALMARHFRLGPIRIELLGFLGFARYQRSPTPGRALLVTAAGPGASLLLGFVSLILLLAFEIVAGAGVGGGRALGLVHTVLLYSAWINIVFGVFNLLPMRPLDGGSLLDSGLVKLGMAPRKVDRLVAVVSLVLAAIVAVVGVTSGEWFLLFVALWVASRNLPSLGVQLGARRY